jgi:hypothetical protein
MDDCSSYAFGGCLVRFSPIGQPPQYRVFLAGSASVIRTAEEHRLPEEQLVARVEAIASSGARLPVSRADDRELEFEIGMVG